MTTNHYGPKETSCSAKSSSILFLVLLIFPFILPQLTGAQECPEIDRKLINQLLDDSDYRIASLGTFPRNTQEEILGKTGNNCPGITRLDPSVEAYGILLKDKFTNHYYVYHAVECDCDKRTPWRITEFAEFSDDIPIIRPVSTGVYIDSQTYDELEIDAAWKGLSVELLRSGAEIIYRKKREKVLICELTKQANEFVKSNIAP